jgi:hypothetical protein
VSPDQRKKRSEPRVCTVAASASVVKMAPVATGSHIVLPLFPFCASFSTFKLNFVCCIDKLQWQKMKKIEEKSEIIVIFQKKNWREKMRRGVSDNVFPVFVCR